MGGDYRRFVAVALLVPIFVLSACGAPPARSDTSQALPLRNEILSSVNLVGHPELFDTPWDATPDPDGQQIYFTATGQAGSGVFGVPFAGGATRAVAVGDPFVAPRGLAISTDGQQLYVADPEAAGADGRTGRIFVVPAAGGAPAALAGTAGTAPRGLEVVREGGADVLYFSGVDASSGQPAVMKVAVAGTGAVSVIASGAPLKEPVGVAVSKGGVVYVADRLASGNDLGSVFRITGATVESIASNVRLGKPVVGATLTLDESTLLVSALAADRDSAQVLLIAVPGLEKGIVNKVIEANTGSGGVHRAHNRNVFAWADSTVGLGRQRGGGASQGGVYALAP